MDEKQVFNKAEYLKRVGGVPKGFRLMAPSDLRVGLELLPGIAVPEVLHTRSVNTGVLVSGFLCVEDVPIVEAKATNTGQVWRFSLDDLFYQEREFHKDDVAIGAPRIFLIRVDEGASG